MTESLGGKFHQPSNCIILPVLLDSVAEFPKRGVVFRSNLDSALFGKLSPWSIATGVV